MPKRRLGQHFLYDPAILRRIIDASGLTPEDTVVEVGPGPGRLTRMLAQRAGRVIAIELDRRLHERLKEELEGWENIELVQGDALRYPYEEAGVFKVVANIPYQITTPLIFRLLELGDRLRSMTMTVQEEVARRITAPPGGKDYGVLSIMVQYHGRAELRFRIPRGAFRPAPKVDSACLHIEVLKSPAVKTTNEELFFRLVKTAFSQRRKTISNALRTITPDMRQALLASGIEPSRRPGTLSMEEFARLSDHIHEPSP